MPTVIPASGSGAAGGCLPVAADRDGVAGSAPGEAADWRGVAPGPPAGRAEPEPRAGWGLPAAPATAPQAVRVRPSATAAASLDGANPIMPDSSRPLRVGRTGLTGHQGPFWNPQGAPAGNSPYAMPRAPRAGENAVDADSCVGRSRPSRRRVRSGRSAW